LIGFLLKIVELHIYFVTAGGTFGRGEGNIKITASLGNLPYFPLLNP
jgi:hypothetical protein